MFTVLIRYRFNRNWLQMSREQREEYETSVIQPIFQRYAERIQVRVFDAEAFHTDFTDFMLLTVSDLQAYYFMIEEIRDSVLITEGFLEFSDITIGIENGYREFARQQKASA